MLTAYDGSIASAFEESGVEVLLVGDSAANVMMKSGTTLPITVDDMMVFARSVTNAVQRPLVVVDLPFGSYEISSQQAVETSVRFMKEAACTRSSSKVGLRGPKPSGRSSTRASRSWAT